MPADPPAPPGPPDPPLQRLEGRELLQGISRELVRSMKDYFGKGPVKAKTYLADDLCFVVLREALTQAELTMLKSGDPSAVRDFRLAYQAHMEKHLVGTVEQLTGRKVIGYQSQVLFGPDLLIEVFVFEDEAEETKLT